MALRREADGDGDRLVAYVVPRQGADAEAAAADEAGQVAQWQALYDETYARGLPAESGADPTFDVQGWNSSYTGEPIPAAEMREWVDGTVARLLALEHRRVLEVGCGTGLLLFRVAPSAERYRGLDLSAVALAQVRAGLDRHPLPQVELAQGTAGDWSGAGPGEFDLVILNSVVQYFPDVDYLARALERAVAAVAPGGAVFVGDVRSLPLLEAFHASVQLHQAPGAQPAAELARRVRRRVQDEEELVLDPALFLALARRLPAVRRVRLRMQRGRAANELTRFRYDAVLYVGGTGTGTDGGWTDTDAPSHPWVSLGEVERLLGEGPAALAVSGIPNARLAGEAAALELLGGEGFATVEELRAEIGRRVRERPGVDPEALWALADRLGYEADLLPSAEDGRFEAVFHRPARSGCRERPLPARGRISPGARTPTIRCARSGRGACRRSCGASWRRSCRSRWCRPPSSSSTPCRSTSTARSTAPPSRRRSGWGSRPSGGWRPRPPWRSCSPGFPPRCSASSGWGCATTSSPSAATRCSPPSSSPG